jgi:SRSO17 transposase
VKLVDEYLEAGFPKLTVVTDSWFDSKELMEAFSERGLNFVTELKSKRKVRNGSGYNVPYKDLSEHFRKPHGEVYAKSLASKRGKGRPCLRFTETKVVQLKSYKSPIRVVALYNKRSSRRAFGYFASTDRTMPGATVWKFCRARWAIEVMFRDLKQNLSFGTLPCGGCRRPRKSADNGPDPSLANSQFFMR